MSIRAGAAVALIALTAAATPAAAASFDCGKAKTPDETAICADQTLSELDVAMATLYGVRMQIPMLMGARGAAQDEQRAWPQGVRQRPRLPDAELSAADRRPEPDDRTSDAGLLHAPRHLRLTIGLSMSRDLVQQFDTAMFDIYRRAKAEAKYNATIFLQMVNDRGGLSTAKYLINAAQPSEGYTHLYERGRLDLTVEAMIVENERWHSLFTPEELAKARVRLKQYGYALD